MSWTKNFGDDYAIFYSNKNEVWMWISIILDFDKRWLNYYKTDSGTSSSAMWHKTFMAPINHE